MTLTGPKPVPLMVIGVPIEALVGKISVIWGWRL
jgi:hypothetical protein